MSSRHDPTYAASLFLTFALAATQQPIAQQPMRSVEDAVPRGRILAAAAEIDRLLQADLDRAHETANPIVDDATFVRRAFLDLTGRIPTLAETETFLADQAADKRAALVDRLLDSPGHTSHTANFWFDLLRAKSRQRQLSGEPFLHWIREAIAQDKAYDEFVREMLVAEGPAHREGNGATGFLLRDANMPHDAMANTLRLFLGTRLECAQCHDHPFDHWKQKEFYEMAAFFGGLRYRVELENPEAGRSLRGSLRDADDRQKQVARRVLQELTQGLAGSGSGIERLPADYKYKDAKPRSTVLANTIFGADVELATRPAPARAAQRRPAADAPRRDQGPRDAEAKSRRAFAEWLASGDNPRFATVIVNRLWQRAFGRALIEPVDDLKDDTRASNPALQRYLEQLLCELKFDLRQFERALAQTQLFQRAAVAADLDPEGPAFRFAGPLLRRMTAEQTWDSLLTLVFDDLDQRLRPTGARAREVYTRYAELASASPEALAARIAEGPQRPQQQRAPQQRPQDQAMSAAAREQARPLQRQLQAARTAGNRQEVERLTAELQKLGVPLPGDRAARGREGELLRASDLVQPAPPNHLLRQFGQSDRETVDGPSTAANVPQVLTLLNGFLDQRVLGAASALRRDLEAQKDPQRRIRVAFLTMLSREPTRQELADWQREIAAGGDRALKDLAWVLANSNEFRFVR